jgi:hypothetical protein
MITAHPEYAYRPRPGDRTSPGSNHAVLDQPLNRARFRRQAGDALCKPAAKFWGLYDDGPHQAPVDCQRCLATARRHGVTLRPRVRPETAP